MRLALEQARLAFDDGEVPVGAVLVSGGGQVLAAARNAAEGAADPTAHAELLCIRQAATAAGGWRLLDATLYVTLEPCPMCAGALLQVRRAGLCVPLAGARQPCTGAGAACHAACTRVSASTPQPHGACPHGMCLRLALSRNPLPSACSLGWGPWCMVPATPCWVPTAAGSPCCRRAGLAREAPAALIAAAVAPAVLPPKAAALSSCRQRLPPRQRCSPPGRTRFTPTWWCDGACWRQSAGTS